MEIIDWLDKHHGAVTAVATVVLAVITGYYVVLTLRLIKSNNEPRIVIYSHLLGKDHIYLRVKNIGTGLAYDVQFNTDLSFRFSHRSLEDIGFLRHGIRCLPPMEKRESYLCHIDAVQELIKTQITITVTYRDSLNKEHQPKTFCLDFPEHIGEFY